MVLEVRDQRGNFFARSCSVPLSHFEKEWLMDLTMRVCGFPLSVARVALHGNDNRAEIFETLPAERRRGECSSTLLAPRHQKLLKIHILNYKRNSELVI